MRYIFSLLFLMMAHAGFAQATPDPAKKVEVVKASCAQCKFGFTGHDCTLAVKYKGRVYIVEGTDINAHGDAHAKDGFCNAVRHAEVQGEVVNDKFKVSYFKLLPEEKKK